MICNVNEVHVNCHNLNFSAAKFFVFSQMSLLTDGAFRKIQQNTILRHFKMLCYEPVIRYTVDIHIALSIMQPYWFRHCTLL
jgi:hypothetical protein